jgi:hypothetical protein
MSTLSLQGFISKIPNFPRFQKSQFSSKLNIYLIKAKLKWIPNWNFKRILILLMAQIVLTFLMKKFFLLNDDENAMNWLGRMVSWALDVDVQNSSKPQKFNKPAIFSDSTIRTRT